MLGMLINDIEQREIEYLIKRELEELLFDMEDSRLDKLVRTAMLDRYKVLFKLFRRVANEGEIVKYIPKTKSE
ncbi:hypothetical protein BN1058_02855 [Paraliobacillus sp. PM-2]|uniref:hypothetical protein n=1 Tax=Paraliobacillus sp. PM-2 TaxID=1462524 RepID=UPI00061CB501|nr:hypothetical protein [Paraliobacillus sp. PM-2]CQR48473.1 hypothetical protein BN1058_02855 [Paraliobacillus sp. PM-2]